MRVLRKLEINIMKPDSRFLSSLGDDIYVVKTWSNSNGEHRTDGPAIIYPKACFWYVDGIYQQPDPNWMKRLT
jgi:hypothetical protein